MSKLESMRLFVRVAELGSFAAAAEQQGVDRSVITRQVAALEKALGVQLIVRSTRRQSLTTAGRLYLERCKAIIDAVEEAETEVMEQQLTPKGSIRLSLPLSFGVRHLSELLVQFAQQYPDVELQLEYDDNFVDLVQQGFDLSIRVATEPASNDIVRRLGSCGFKIVASEAYLTRHGIPESPEALQQHICLQYRNATRWNFTIAGKQLSIPTSGRIRANNGDALAEAAVHGLGLARLPDFIASEYLEQQRLKEVLANCSDDTIGIYAVLPSNHYIPQRVRMLIDFLAEHLPTALQGK